jgi:hypothetical protein
MKRHDETNIHNSWSEFLVGDHINRQLGHKYNVWVPTKDSGVDLLVTRKGGKGRAAGLRVKFSIVEGPALSIWPALCQAE